jgi:flagellar basal body-associated protein FliL
MAIVLEEEKKQTNWIAIFSVIVILAIIFSVGYYVFFKNPSVIEQTTVPDKLQTLSQLSQANFDPQSVVGSKVFQSLQTFTTPLALPPAGRSNPFKPAQ